MPKMRSVVPLWRVTRKVGSSLPALIMGLVNRIQGLLTMLGKHLPAGLKGTVGRTLHMAVTSATSTLGKHVKRKKGKDKSPNKHAKHTWRPKRLNSGTSYPILGTIMMLVLLMSMRSMYGMEYTHVDVDPMTTGPPCHRIGGWETFPLGDTQEVRRTLSSDKCSVFMFTNRPMLKMTLEKLDLAAALRPAINIMLDVQVDDIVNDDGCPGGHTPNCARHIDKDQTIHLQHDCYPQRGWGDGCGLFGLGHTCLGLTFKPTEVMRCQSIEVDNIMARISYQYGDTREGSFNLNGWNTGNVRRLNSNGTQRMILNCVVRNLDWYQDRYACMIHDRSVFSTYLVPKQVIHELDAPHSAPNQAVWENYRKFFRFMDCSPSAISFAVIDTYFENVLETMQTYPKVEVTSEGGAVLLLKGDLLGGLSEITHPGTVSCLIDFRGLTMDVLQLPPCAGSAMTADLPTPVQVSDDHVRIHMKMAALENAPCKIIPAIPGCTAETSEYAYKAGMELQINLICMRGSYVWRIGKDKITFVVANYGVYKFAKSIVNSMGQEIINRDSGKRGAAGFVEGVWVGTTSFGHVLGSWLSHTFSLPSTMMVLALGVLMIYLSMAMHKSPLTEILFWVGVVVLAGGLIPMVTGELVMNSRTAKCINDPCHGKIYVADGELHVTGGFQAGMGYTRRCQAVFDGSMSIGNCYLVRNGTVAWQASDAEYLEENRYYLISLGRNHITKTVETSRPKRASSRASNRPNARTMTPDANWALHSANYIEYLEEFLNRLDYRRGLTYVLVIIIVWWFTKNKFVAGVVAAALLMSATPVLGTEVGCMVNVDRWAITCGRAHSVDWDPRWSLEIRPMQYTPFGPSLKFRGITMPYGVVVLQTTNARLHQAGQQGASSVSWMATLHSMVTRIVTVGDPDGQFEVGSREELFEDWLDLHEATIERKATIVIVGDCRTNLGNVIYIPVDAEDDNSDAYLLWTLSHEPQQCDRNHCPIVEATCRDQAPRYCSSGDNYWAYAQLYGYRVTTFFQGTARQKCHHKRRSWAYIAGWMCDLHEDGAVRAHILPHTNGGDEKGYNCWPQSYYTNENATKVESRITEGSWVQRELRGRDVLTARMLVAIPSVIEDWRVGCFCGWDGVSIPPPTCNNWTSPYANDSQIVVVWDKNLTSAKKLWRKRDLVIYTPSCIQLDEKLTVTDVSDSWKVYVYENVDTRIRHATSALAMAILGWINPLLGGAGTAIYMLEGANAWSFEDTGNYPNNDTFDYIRPDSGVNQPWRYSVFMDDFLVGMNVRASAALLLMMETSSVGMGFLFGSIAMLNPHTIFLRNFCRFSLCMSLCVMVFLTGCTLMVGERIITSYFFIMAIARGFLCFLTGRRNEGLEAVVVALGGITEKCAIMIWSGILSVTISPYSTMAVFYRVYGALWLGVVRNHNGGRDAWCRVISRLIRQDLGMVYNSVQNVAGLVVLSAGAYVWSLDNGPVIVCTFTILGLLSTYLRPHLTLEPISHGFINEWDTETKTGVPSMVLDDDGQAVVPPQERGKVLMLVGLIVMVLLFWAGKPFDACMALVLTCVLLKKNQVDALERNANSSWDLGFPVRNDMDETTMTVVPDGVYTVQAWFCMVPMIRGRAVVYEQVVHTSYHVTKGRDLHWGGKPLSIFSANIPRDIATYGGPWRLPQVDPEKEVLLMHPATKKLIKSSISDSKKNNDGTWSFVTSTIVTTPGESGSPIYQHDGKDWVPVGMNGVNYMSSASDNLDAVLFCTMEEGDAWNVEMAEAVKRKGLHVLRALGPGSGKTRIAIPNAARLAEAHTKRLLVLGPTRVVAREILNAVESAGVSPSYVIGNDRKNDSKYVEILCHATFHNRLMRNPDLLKKYDVVIMDESGFELPETISLMKILRDRLTRGGPSLIEMSATGEEVVPTTRYPVEMRTASSIDGALYLVPELLTKKVVLFVASATSAAAKLQKWRCDEWPVLIIDRQHYDTNIEKATEMPVGMLVCTRIAEAGFNPNADVVIDTQLDIRPVRDGSRVELLQVPITTRQMVQRRGRVGRRKPGTYFAVGGGELEMSRWHDKDALWDDVDNSGLPVTTTSFRFTSIQPHRPLIPATLHHQFPG